MDFVPFLERARVEREGGRDLDARLALGAYLVARLAARLLERGSRDDDESVQWQLDSTERYLGELPDDAVETGHLLSLCTTIRRVGFLRGAGIAPELMAYALFLRHEGRYAEGLAVVELAVRLHGPQMEPAQFIPCALTAARLNRLLARWEAATRAYRAAEEAAVQVGDVAARLWARLGQASVLRSTGNLPASRVLVESVITEADGSVQRDVLAAAWLDLGAVLERLGHRTEALRATFRAFEISAEEHERMRVLGDLGVMLAEGGADDLARQTLQLVVASRADQEVRLNAMVELLGIAGRMGDRLGFERQRRALQALHDRLPPSQRIDFRMKLAQGWRVFEEEAESRRLLVEALELAEQHALNQWVFRIEAELVDHDRRREAVRQSVTEAAVASGVLDELRSGLERYVAQQAS